MILANVAEQAPEPKTERDYLQYKNGWKKTVRKWNDLFKNASLPLFLNSLSFVSRITCEFVYRIGPAGVSSGVSLRELPKARVEDLTKICQHYEQKCSGIYSSDSAAARWFDYLFTFSHCFFLGGGGGSFSRERFP